MEHRIPQRKRKKPPPKDARARRSREGLRSALLLLLEARPFEDITIRDISAKADVGYTTYFRHYPSKEALLDDVALVEIERLCDLTVPVYDSGDTGGACLTLCAYVQKHRAVWTALLTGGAAALVRKEMLRQTQALSATRRPPRSWLPRELSSVLAVSCMVEVLTWWLQQATPVSVAKAAAIMHRVAIMPVEAAAPVKAKPRRAKTIKRG